MKASSPVPWFQNSEIERLMRMSLLPVIGGTKSSVKRSASKIDVQIRSKALLTVCLIDWHAVQVGTRSRWALIKFNYSTTVSRNGISFPLFSSIRSVRFCLVRYPLDWIDLILINYSMLVSKNVINSILSKYCCKKVKMSRFSGRCLQL